MNIKYEAMDGTIFSNESECKEYEAKLNETKPNEDKSFLIQYCIADDDEPYIKTYHGDGTKFDLRYFIECVHAFKIVEGIDNWNIFVDENFSGLDDDIYYHYETPILEGDFNEWLCYNQSGELELFEDYIISMENYIERLKEIRKY